MQMIAIKQVQARRRCKTAYSTAYSTAHVLFEMRKILVDKTHHIDHFVVL